MNAQKTRLPSETKTVKKRHRIFLVDDHPITRDGVSTLINQQPHLIVCGEADNASEALERIPQARADMAIVDVTLRTTSGIELMKSLKSQHPQLPVLIMSMHEESMYAERSLRAGAKGYIMKQEANSKILEAINTILRGELYLSAAIKEKMLHVLVKSSVNEVKFSLDNLSDRELEVYRLVGNGFGTREIAAKLCLSSKTIDSYRENLKVKLRLNKGSELVQHAIQWVKSENVN
jgi:DNA-binding NarL/FixJ family response regulator